LTPLSWLTGMALVAAVVVYVGPQQLTAMFRSIGVVGVLAWSAITIAARLVQTGTTVAPLSVLGFRVHYGDVFWMGWLRTFANQVLPAAGVVAYIKALRHKFDIPWPQLAALATPQFVLAAAALGIIGVAAVLSNLEAPDLPHVLLLTAYGVVLLVAVGVARGAHTVLRVLPPFIAERLETTSDALRDLAKRPQLLLVVIASHTGTILLRGSRVWLLFAMVGYSLSWNEALLIAAVAESSILIQFTPGGLGIREGALLVGAALVGIPIEAAAGIAVVDRILMLAITALLAPPAVVALR
jgi:uncharacterized membrane protein YbhN (UPF0104 family)